MPYTQLQIRLWGIHSTWMDIHDQYVALERRHLFTKGHNQFAVCLLLLYKGIIKKHKLFSWWIN